MDVGCLSNNGETVTGSVAVHCVAQLCFWIQVCVLHCSANCEYKTQCAHNWYVCSLYTTLYSPLYTTQTGNTVFNVQYSALLPLLPWCATRVTRQHIPSAGSKGRIVNKARRLSRTQDSSTSQLITSILTIIFKKHPMTKHLLPKMCIECHASFAIQIPPQTNGKYAFSGVEKHCPPPIYRGIEPQQRMYFKRQ